MLIFALSGCIGAANDNKKPMPLHWIEDQSNELTFEEVNNKDVLTQWNQAENHQPSFGFTDSTYWFNTSIKNTRIEPTPILLEVALPLHDSIDVYLLKGEELVSTYHSGDKSYFFNRPLNHRNFLFPQLLQPNEELKAVIRVNSTDAMYVPIKIWESNEFFAKDQHEVLFLGLAFGCLLIMLAYNLFLYLLTKNVSYFYYVCYAASIMYLQLSQKGIGYQYLWSDFPFFNQVSTAISAYLAVLMGVTFIWKFLELEYKAAANSIFIFKCIFWVSLVGTVSHTAMLAFGTLVAPFSQLIVIAATFGSVSALVILVLLVQLSRQGSTTARIILVSWLFLLGGSVFFVLGRLGFPVPMVLSENAMLIGSTIEAALISFALARQIKIEREARRKAQDSLVILQEKTTQQLEQKVRERTTKLEIAMDNLTVANNKLDNLSRIDSLTGLANRRDFDERFNETWGLCSSLEEPISLLMADIDNFKSINDTYGHLFGDQCLIKVADVLRHCVSNPNHLAARFGGEEFIIMMHSTDEDVASVIAENIRQGIEALEFSCQGESVKFTISIGLSCVTPTKDSNFVDLNERADQALYAAKENGRNQVVVADSHFKNVSASN